MNGLIKEIGHLVWPINWILAFVTNPVGFGNISVRHNCSSEAKIPASCPARFSQRLEFVFLFTCGFGHAGLRHFLLDVGEQRLVRFFLRFNFGHTHMML